MHNKFYRFTTSIVILILLNGCLEEPIGYIGIIEAEIPTVNIFQPLSSGPVEGIFWYNFEMTDRYGESHQVDAYFGQEHIGVGFPDSIDSNNIMTGKITINSLQLPENAVLNVVAKDGAGNYSSSKLNLSVVQRKTFDFYSSTHGGQLAGTYNSIQDGKSLPDGSTWFVTYAGIVIIDNNYSLTFIDNTEICTGSNTIQNIVVTNQGEVQFIDSHANILKWDGNNATTIGQFDRINNFAFKDILIINDEYFAICENHVLKYNLILDSTFVYPLAFGPGGYRASAMGKGPFNQIYAAFYAEISGFYTKMFQITGESWSELSLPPGEPSDNFDDYKYGRINAILTDNENRVWFSRGESIFKIEGNIFTQIRLPKNYSAAGPYSFWSKRGYIKDMLIDEHSNLWIARGAGGLIKYDFNWFYIYPVNSISDKHTSGSSETPSVNRLYRALNNDFFVHTFGNEVGSVLTYFKRIIPN